MDSANISGISETKNKEAGSPLIVICRDAVYNRSKKQQRFETFSVFRQYFWKKAGWGRENIDTRQTLWEDLSISNDFLFGKIMQKPEDSYVEKLEEAVQEAKKNREWRHEYMTLLMRDQENVEKGEEMLAKLIMLLNEDGRLSDVIKVSQDKEYRQSLYLEYHII